MADFIDRVKIHIKSGKGGDGHVSFRREKYVANGGPDGGDGGKGGDVIFEVDEGLNTLSDFHYNGKYKAEPGGDGRAKRCSGRSGEDLVVKVPEGTLVREFESGQIIADLSGPNRRVTILKGGRGGSGNMHYATATMQAPKYAQPGKPAKELDVLLELKLIADAGLVGFPNVGKSTFLTKVSAARPKVADYHFTTLSPMPGVVRLDDMTDFVIADIPGLIEGASTGLGLGHDFLRHIDRCRVLVHVVDAASVEGRDPLADIRLINNELARYNADITNKRQIICANKIDLLPEGAEAGIIHEIRALYEPQGIPVFAVSTLTGEGLKSVLYALSDILKETGRETVVYEQEYFPEEGTQAVEDYTVRYDKKQGEYIVEGALIDKMLGYTNIESEKGFVFFQRFLEEHGVNERLQALGIREGDTVRMYGHAFEYLPGVEEI
ncbi:MAG: GTPase ObgE [Lachnospiraceae bacterium]|nr:GTPase ObgE [Lachnospiraceae bacterium]